MPLESGKLRHRLTILQPSEEQDSDTGDMDITWSVLDIVWGSFEPLSTKEYIASASNQNEMSVRAVIRYRSDITADMRISFKSRTYAIIGPPLPDKIYGNEYLTLMLAEV